MYSSPSPSSKDDTLSSLSDASSQSESRKRSERDVDDNCSMCNRWLVEDDALVFADGRREVRDGSILLHEADAAGASGKHVVHWSDVCRAFEKTLADEADALVPRGQGGAESDDAAGTSIPVGSSASEVDPRFSIYSSSSSSAHEVLAGRTSPQIDDDGKALAAPMPCPVPGCTARIDAKIIRLACATYTEHNTCGICSMTHYPDNREAFGNCGGLDDWHRFCKTCLRNWLRVKHNCPTCRNEHRGLLEQENEGEPRDANLSDSDDDLPSSSNDRICTSTLDPRVPLRVILSLSTRHARHYQATAPTPSTTHCLPAMRFCFLPLFLALSMLLFSTLVLTQPADEVAPKRVLRPASDYARLFSPNTQVTVQRDGRSATMSYTICPSPSQPTTLLRYAKYIEFAQLDGLSDIYTSRVPMCEHDTCEMRVRESGGCLSADLLLLFPVDVKKQMVVRIFDFTERLEYLFQ